MHRDPCYVPIDTPFASTHDDYLYDVSVRMFALLRTRSADK